jgi:hypothetical protein
MRKKGGEERGERSEPLPVFYVASASEQEQQRRKEMWPFKFETQDNQRPLIIYMYSL